VFKSEHVLGTRKQNVALIDKNRQRTERSQLGAVGSNYEPARPSSTAGSIRSLSCGQILKSFTCVELLQKDKRYVATTAIPL
jgi:hypothetical protein